MQKKDKEKEQIKFGKLIESAYSWQGALPLGNGNIGALVKMGARKEEISFILSEATYGGSVGVLPDVSDKLKDVRALINGSNPVVAGATMEGVLKNKKYTPTLDALMPIGDFVIKFLNAGKITNYSKELVFSEGEVKCGYNNGTKKVLRRSFLSNKDGQLYYEVTGIGGIDMELSVASHDKKMLVFDGKVFGAGEGCEEESDQSINLLYNQRVIGGMVYGVVLRVLVDNNAVLSVERGVLRVENAEKMLVIVRPYAARVREKYLEKAKAELLALRGVSYEKALKEHVDEFQKVWGKQEMTLSYEKDDFVENKKEKDLSWTIEKLFYMAKYLMAIGFNEKSIQCFTGGLWEMFYGNTGALVDTSVALPALYSGFLSFGKDEKVKPVIDYTLKHLDDTKKVANRLYKSAGYEVPSFFVLGSMLPGKVDAESLSTITGGASLANLMYEYFLYTKDIKFLKTEALPFMCGVADFYLNYFKVDASGKLESVPSFAPYGKTKAFQYKEGLPQKNAVCDFVMVKALLSNIINANNVYSMPVMKIIEYQNFLNKLPVKTITANKVEEFLGDEASEISSGVLHLYPVFGSREVNVFSNPEEVQLVVDYIKSRLDKNISAFNVLSLARILECLSVLGAKELFSALLEFMVKNYLSSNLVFLNNDKFGVQEGALSDNCFNIAVNMVVLSAILNTFVLDIDNNICVLPCRIGGVEKGSISGIQSRNNVLVDVAFDDKKGSCSVILKALRTANFNLVLFKGVKKVKGYTIDPLNPRINNISIAAGKSVTIDIKY